MLPRWSFEIDKLPLPQPPQESLGGGKCSQPGEGGFESLFLPVRQGLHLSSNPERQTDLLAPERDLRENILQA